MPNLAFRIGRVRVQQANTSCVEAFLYSSCLSIILPGLSIVASGLPDGVDTGRVDDDSEEDHCVRWLYDLIVPVEKGILGMEWSVR